MTLTITHYDVTITVKHERDDLTIDEMVELLKTVLYTMGYGADTVQRAFGEE